MSAVPSKVPLVLDTDIGTDIDDTVALAAALGSPTLRLVGISTVYVDAPLRARIAGRLLELAGVDDVAVWAGESVPVRTVPALAEQGIWEWHEGRGILYDHISPEEQEYIDGRRPRARSYENREPADAPERLARLAADHANLVVVCIGPLTNIATALARYPEVERSIGTVTIMGGCFRPGVPEPQFEHNLAADPGATEIVFRSSLPLTVVGFDATESCYLVRDRVSPLCGSHTPFSAALNRLIDVYFDVKGRWRTSMHDPLAVAVSEDPEVGVLETTDVFVDPATGNTSLDPFAGCITKRVSLLKSVWPERGESFVYERLHLACRGGGR